MTLSVSMGIHLQQPSGPQTNLKHSYNNDVTGCLSLGGWGHMGLLCDLGWGCLLGELNYYQFQMV